MLITLRAFFLQSSPDLKISQAFVMSLIFLSVCFFLTSQNVEPSTNKSFLKIFKERSPGGGTPYMKGVGMLVVLLRGINFGFWSHLRCSG